MNSEKYEKYIDLLLKWNKTHSVTNYNKKELQQQIKITTDGIKYLPTIKTAIDIGTGAGIPGLILAIAMPNVKWYLVEPLQKRYSFLNYAKLSLGLKNVEIIPKRLENVEPFIVDLITSRAVKEIPFLLKISKEFCNKNTTFLLYKGENVKNELTKIELNSEIHKENNINYVLLNSIS